MYTLIVCAAATRCAFPLFSSWTPGAVQDLRAFGLQGSPPSIPIFWLFDCLSAWQSSAHSSDHSRFCLKFTFRSPLYRVSVEFFLFLIYFNCVSISLTRLSVLRGSGKCLVSLLAWLRAFLLSKRH